MQENFHFICSPLFFCQQKKRATFSGLYFLANVFSFGFTKSWYFFFVLIYFPFSSNFFIIFAVFFLLLNFADKIMWISELNLLKKLRNYLTSRCSHTKLSAFLHLFLKKHKKQKLLAFHSNLIHNQSLNHDIKDWYFQKMKLKMRNQTQRIFI